MAIDTKSQSGSATRQKLLDAAITLMRRNGFTATTVDQICAEAGVTKGAFFHYFKSKDEVAEAALEEWCRSRVALYLADLGDATDDPLDRLNRWMDGLIASVRAPDEPLVCLLGMLSQELAGSHEQVRESCLTKLTGWTGFVVELLEAAKKAHPPQTDFNSEEVAWMLNSLWQGSLLVAKTRRDPELIARNLDHARAYVEGLFSLTRTP